MKKNYISIFSRLVGLHIFYIAYPSEHLMMLMDLILGKCIHPAKIYISYLSPNHTHMHLILNIIAGDSEVSLVKNPGTQGVSVLLLTELTCYLFLPFSISLPSSFFSISSFFSTYSFCFFMMSICSCVRLSQVLRVQIFS